LGKLQDYFSKEVLRLFIADSYDVAVIGGGHAGIEAALAAARLGCKTCVFVMTLDSIATNLKGWE